MLESIGVSVQLAAVEGYLLGFGLGGLEIHHAIGAIVEIDYCIELASQKERPGMAREYDRKRLDPLFGHSHNTREKGGIKVGGRVAGKLGFHQAVDGTKNRWKGGGRPRDAVDVFKIETTWALIPQESQIGGAKLNRIGGHGLPLFLLGIRPGSLYNLFYIFYTCVTVNTSLLPLLNQNKGAEGKFWI
jgi:hypothetical protein